MIVKPRDFPSYLLQVEALNRRLPSHHRDKQRILEQAQRLRAGYNGEVSLDFELNFLPEKKYRVFQGLRFQDEYGIFQLDMLLLSECFALIIEIKNVYGTLTFDGMGQVIRRTEKIEEGFNNPIEQVNLQQYRFRRLLQKHPFPAFPLEKIVVFSNPRTIIKYITNSKNINDMVMHRNKVISRITQFSHTFTTPCLTKNELVQLSNLLITEHKVEQVEVLDKFQILQSELIKGVFCTECNAIPIKRIYGKWICDHCGHTCKNAHLLALEDYQLLISPMINNRQARNFLSLDSIHVTKKLLQKAGFKQIGTTSARKYLLDRRGRF